MLVSKLEPAQSPERSLPHGRGDCESIAENVTCC
jgi:hypothetical protein